MGKENYSEDEAQILKEITFFIGRFFLTEIKEPTVEDMAFAERLAKLTILLMAQMLERGIREREEPVFNAMFYV